MNVPINVHTHDWNLWIDKFPQDTGSTIHQNGCWLRYPLGLIQTSEHVAWKTARQSPIIFSTPCGIVMVRNWGLCYQMLLNILERSFWFDYTVVFKYPDDYNLAKDTWKLHYVDMLKVSTMGWMCSKTKDDYFLILSIICVIGIRMLTGTSPHSGSQNVIPERIIVTNMWNPV